MRASLQANRLHQQTAPCKDAVLEFAPIPLTFEFRESVSDIKFPESFNLSNRGITSIILLLDRVRRVGIEEARRLVQAEHGEQAATTLQVINEDSPGMQYIDWRFESAPYHIGTSSEPYINVIGVGKIDEQTGIVGSMKMTMREEVPPEGEAECDAWMSHAAWMYVDALLFHSTSPEEDRRHHQHVLRIAGQLVDERCVLLWLCGPNDQPKQVALPTPAAIAALKAGSWPL